jgi:hypothetical protein
MAGLRFEVEFDAVLLILHILELVTPAVVASAPIFHAEPGARARWLRLQVMGAGFRAMEESRRAGGQACWQCYEESVKEEMNRKDRAEKERRINWEASKREKIWWLIREQKIREPKW